MSCCSSVVQNFAIDAAVSSSLPSLWAMTAWSTNACSDVMRDAMSAR